MSTLLVDYSLVLPIAAIVISVAGIIPLYIDLIRRHNEQRAENIPNLERFQIPTNSLLESYWGIRVLSPNRMIEHCSVDIEWGVGMKVLMQIENTQVYETKIPKGGSASFRVPKGIVPEGSTIVVKDRIREILRRRADDVPLVNP